MTNLIWHRDQQSDITRKGDLAYKCWRSGAVFPDGAKLLFGRKVFIPADIAPQHHVPHRQHDRQPEGHRGGKDRAMKLRFEKIDDQDYDVYADMDNCLGSVHKMDNYWRAACNGRGRRFHYRHEAAEWLVSINQAEQSDG